MDKQHFLDLAVLIPPSREEFKNEFSLFLELVKNWNGTENDFFGPVIDDLSQWLSITKKCIASLKENSPCLNSSTIPWHPNNKDKLEMLYLSGDSPWTFVLSYNMSSEMKTLTKNIEVKWQNGLLKKIENPSVGSFICCCDNKNIYRGFILDVLPNEWVRVLNVDKYQIKGAKLDSCYHMTSEFSVPHTNAIKCCLVKDEYDAKKWNSDLAGLFQGILRDSRLSIRILDKMDSLPPTYLVELYAFNESLEVETNISHWVSSRLLPALQKLNVSGDSKELCTYLDEEDLDPYLCIFDCGLKNSISDCGSNDTLNLEEKRSENINENAEKPLEMGPTTSLFHTRIDHMIMPNARAKTMASIKKNSQDPWEKGLQGKTDCTSQHRLFKTEHQREVTVKSDQNRKTSKDNFKFEYVLDAPEFQPANNFSSTSFPRNVELNKMKTEGSESGMNSAAKDTVDDEICSFYSSKGFCWKPGCKKVHKLIEGGSGSFMNSAAKDTVDDEICSFYSSKGFCWKPGCKKVHKRIEEDPGCHVYGGKNEDTVLPSNYNPRDDHRICSFYAQKGYCWKRGCQREHKKTIDGKWTDDSREIFKESEIKLYLPLEGTKTILTVTHVLCANTFYAILPHSPANEKDDETIESLILAINNPSVLNELKMLHDPPCFGQLLIAYSSIKGMWLRASLYDVCDSNIIQVYFIDFGMTEEITLASCREILPEHVHLPNQAVYCTLSGLFIVNFEDEGGKEFLEELILDKDIEMEIVVRNVADSALQVLAYTDDGKKINEIMIQKGFCSVFSC